MFIPAAAAPLRAAMAKSYAPLAAHNNPHLAQVSCA